MSVVLWAARHAPAGPSGVCYGRADIATTIPASEAAAFLAGAVPRGDGPLGAVWSSPSARCREVAEILSRDIGCAHRVDPDLCELDFGEWEGRAWSAIEAEDGERCRRWQEDWLRLAPPRGERVADLEARARRWASALDARVVHALVAHAGVVRALRVISCGDAWPEAMRAPVPHLAWARFAL